MFKSATIASVVVVCAQAAKITNDNYGYKAPAYKAPAYKAPAYKAASYHAPSDYKEEKHYSDKSCSGDFHFATCQSAWNFYDYNSGYCFSTWCHSVDGHSRANVIN